LSRSEISHFSEAVVSAYRGWYRLIDKEEGWEAAKYVLINDLSQSAVAARHFNSRAEVRRALEELRDAAPDPKSAERLEQSLSYLDQDPTEGGSREAVVKRGIPWRPIDDSVLDQKLADFEALKRGLIHGGRVSKEEVLTRYNFRSGPPGVSAELERLGRTFLERFRAEYSSLVPADFSMREVVSPSPFHNMVTCEDGALWYITNRHAAVDYNDGRRAFLALHEVGGHVLHFSQLLANKPLQATAPHLLCLAIHTYDAYFIEGIAQYLTALYADRIVPNTVLAMDVKRSELWIAVVHRNMTQMLEGKIDAAGAAECERSYLGGDPKALRAYYEGLLKDLFFCCQIFAYHSSGETLRPALALQGANLADFLNKLLNGHHSPAELDRLVQQSIR